MCRVEFVTKDGKKWYYATYSQYTDAVLAIGTLWKEGTTQVPPDDIAEVVLIIHRQSGVNEY